MSDISIPWENIHATLNLNGGTRDIGVDLSGTVGAALSGAVGVTLAGTVGANANLSGGLTVDAGLDNVRVREIAPVQIDAGLDNVRIKELAPIQTESSVRVTELPTINTNSKVDLGLDNIRIQELPPIQAELAFRPFRLHLPLNFKLCVEVLGITLFKFSVCGEGMAIGEDNQPRQTESCK